MLHNFQLAAIVRQGRQTRLRRIPLHRELQDTLTATWGTQLDAFMEGAQEIEFDAGYQPEEHERFCLDEFELPPWLENVDSLAAPNLDAVPLDATVLDQTKGIVAFARDDADRELMLFQNFSRSHVIHPGRFLLLAGNTYQTAQSPGLTLEDKLSAVFIAVDQRLLFFNFRTVNTFLPLADLYAEASEQEIREVLAHDRLVAEDADSLATGANQWFRKRFAMLRDSRVLEEFTPRQIQARSRGFDVDIHLRNERIVFPADRAAAKKLLQFLNEEIYRGPITETLYETNSKREAD